MCDGDMAHTYNIVYFRWPAETRFVSFFFFFFVSFLLLLFHSLSNIFILFGFNVFFSCLGIPSKYLLYINHANLILAYAYEIGVADSEFGWT